MQPRIAIPLPTSHDEAYNRLNWAVYADVIRASGGEPVSVPLNLSHADLTVLFDTIDGLLLPGSPADVDPKLYGQQRSEECATPDPSREKTDRFLLEQASLQQKTVLGICFGMQMLNVAQGGTLIQDLTILPVNHAASRGVLIAHSSVVHHDSQFATLVDRNEAKTTSGDLRLPINSSHHQAVGLVGHGLVVVARCPQDGVVEAIERSPDCSKHAAMPFLLGVQWHPERTFETSATSRSIFTGFITATAAMRSA